MDTLKHFQKHQNRYEIGATVLLLLINSLVNATTAIMDQERRSADPQHQNWEPFVWELTSAVSLLVILPAIVWLTRSSYSNWSKPGRTLLIYTVATIPFCLAHVSLMVALRKLIYQAQNLNYDFGSWWFELLYEYRKDFVTFIIVLAVIFAYRFISSRLLGQAELVANGEDELLGANIDRILVKKLGKEFIVKIAEIDWLEASGNYVNLHVGARVYPTRTTLSKLIADIEKQGFSRTHRSFAVNLDAIESIETLPSGSGELVLKTGKVLSLSRRYHQNLKNQLAAS